MPKVIAKQSLAHAPQSLMHRRNLHQDIGAIPVFLDHLLNGLTPPAAEVRVHPRQGTSDPSFRWGDRENVIYEIIR